MQNIRIPYRPRPLQKELHATVARFSVVVCHRRFGKTVMLINKIIKDLVNAKMKGLPRPRGIYVAPLFRQAKQVAWDYAKFYLEGMPGYKANESELRIDFLDDCRLFLIGADNPDTVRGIYADSVGLDEYAQMNPKMWSEVLRPALTDRKGSAMFIGTPKGKNMFHEIYQHALNPANIGWSAHLFRASETGYVDAGELLAAQNDMTDEEYAQEYECSWEAAIRGAYYGKLMEQLTNNDQICRVPYDPMLPVNTSWDLGIDDMTAIWFWQNAAREFHIIRYYENSGAGLDHYVNYLRERNYVFGRHYLPHDVNVREISSGRTRKETLRSLGLQVRAGKNLPIDDGINAVRTILPRCYFDLDNCGRGIEALRQYRTAYDDKTQTFRQRPYHDWTSHGADGFRGLALAVDEPDTNTILQTQVISEYDIFDPFNVPKRGETQSIAIGTGDDPW